MLKFINILTYANTSDDEKLAVLVNDKITMVLVTKHYTKR